MLQKAYETFITFHIAAIISFICLIWYHMPREKGYLIATIGLWVTDRFIRWTRILFYNSLWRCGRSSCTEMATLRLLSHDTTRLEVLKPDFAPWKAGAYAYVSTPGTPWWPQSHPFTIASRPSRLHINHSSEATKGGGGGGDILRPQANLIFLIRARNGWTRKLHSLAQNTVSPNIPVIIDGPYDGAPELHKCFDTVLLFAGGAGISWTLPILVDLVEKARRNQSAVRRVIWVCALRHYVNYDWFFGELEQIVQMSGNAWIDVRIHYTTDAQDVANVPAFFRPGRPDIEFIIEEAVNAAKGRLFIGGKL
jgi:ferric-chelate reductase